MKEYLEEKVAAALAAIGAPDGTDAAVERPKTIEHGDLATSVALPLARVLKKAPRAIADDLVAALDFEERYVAKVDVAGPGFINITLTSAFYHDRLADALADPDSFCATSSGAGERVNVEYVSANPTGPLHPGHGRNAALGDTIANMLAASGRDVTREYYFNNAGNQMRNLARSIHSRYRTLLELPTTFPEDGYHGDYIVDIARAIVDEQGDALAEETDENIDRMRSFGEEWNFRMIRKTMDLLGIAHDHFFNEKSLYETGRIKETIAKLGENITIGRVTRFKIGE